MSFDKAKTDAFAVRIRKNILRAIASKGQGHVGGSLSIADALAVLYNDVADVDPADPKKKDRDYVVLSKGHTGPALYSALAAKGFFPEDVLETLNKNDTVLPSHADRIKTTGVDVSTGSLGQGASLAAGVAMADKLDGNDKYTYLILGDGEINEGQVWESFLFVAHRNLCNLITFVDANGKQLDGKTEDICNLGVIEDKFTAFGYNAIGVDGSNTQEIYDAIMKAKSVKDKPTAIVLHTRKGGGIRKFEEMENCHSVAVSKDELEGFYAELDASL